MKKKILVLMMGVFSISCLTSIRSNAFEGASVKDIINDGYKENYSKFYIQDGIYFLEKVNLKNDNAIMSGKRTNEINKKEYKKEVLAIIPKEVVDRKLPLIYRTAGGSEEREEWDETGSIMATLTVNYEFIENDGIEFVRLKSLSGTHTGMNSGVKVKKQKLEYGCTGFVKGGIGYKEQRASYNPSGMKWTKKAPNWKPVYTSESCVVGGNYILVVGRGSSDWSFTVQNNPFDQ